MLDVFKLPFCVFSDVVWTGCKSQYQSTKPLVSYYSYISNNSLQHLPRARHVSGSRAAPDKSSPAAMSDNPNNNSDKEIW